MKKGSGTCIKFLSHASIFVESGEFKLLVDPWLIGSCYWRSWWNYPPVRKETYANIKPDAVYITHFHWDHWHGVSLKKLIDKSTPIITHQEPNGRSVRDLRGIGFKNIITLRHAETIQLGDLQLTAYQFGLFLNDSAIVIKNGDVNLLNANDCKIAGTSLRQILNEHGRFDFALRSHSSANDRICYKIKDDPNFAYDDSEHYNRSFKLFMDAVQPKFAVPFASNHCFLHKDVYHLNNTINDPFLLKHKLEQEGGLRNSELKIMLTGDSWSSKEGFLTRNNKKYFSNKKTYLKQYLMSKSDILSKYYEREVKVKVSEKIIQKFEAQIRAIPHLFRKRLKGWTYDLILYSDQAELQYEVSPFNGTMKLWPHSRDSKAFTSEVRMPKKIFVDAVALNMFHHSSISKRNCYTFSDLEELQKYEYFQRQLEKVELEVYPLSMCYFLKFLAAYVRRWREVIVYFKAYMLRRKGVPIYEVEEEILQDTT